MMTKKLTRNILVWSFICILLICISNSYAAETKNIKWSNNLLLNSSFEDGLKNWQVPSWLRNYLVLPKIDKAIIHGGGMASLKFEGEAGKYFRVYQKITAPSNAKKYKFDCWIKMEDFENSWVVLLTIKCFYKEKADKKFKTKNITAGITHWSKTSLPWTLKSKEFTVPPNTKYISVYLIACSHKCNGSPKCLGRAWFDNVSLRYKQPITSVDNKKDGV